MNQIIQDCRLVAINSQDAYERRNGLMNSDLIFNFPNLLVDSPDVMYNTVSIIDAQIPVAWVLINEYTDTLNFQIVAPSYTYDYSLKLDWGNYTASNITTQLQKQFDLALVSITGNCIVQFDIVTGRLDFKFVGLKVDESVIFLHTGSEGLFRILGFDYQTDYYSVSIGSDKYVYPPKPLNCLGIKSLRICSTHLAVYNSLTSDNSKANSVLAVIPVDQPFWNLICYKNTLPYFSRLKSHTLKTIDLQIYDELGRFVDLQGTNYTLTIQIVTYRKLDITNDKISNLLQQIDYDLQNLGNTKQPDSTTTQDSVTSQENQPTPLKFPEQNVPLAEPTTDLEILQYNSMI